MAQIKILILSRTIDLSSDKIAQISPSIRVIDARHTFDQEILESWPQETSNRYVSASGEGKTSTQSEFEREKGRRNVMHSWLKPILPVLASLILWT